MRTFWKITFINPPEVQSQIIRIERIKEPYFFNWREVIIPRSAKLYLIKPGTPRADPSNEQCPESFPQRSIHSDI